MSDINYYQSYDETRIKENIINDTRKLYHLSPTNPTNPSDNNADIYIEGGKYVAGENMVPYTVVTLDNDRVSAASAQNLMHANKIIGITTGEATKDKLVYVQTEGIVVNTNWNLMEGKIYYLDGLGNINNVCNDASYIQKIGIAESEHKLVIQIGEAIEL